MKVWPAHSPLEWRRKRRSRSHGAPPRGRSAAPGPHRRQILEMALAGQADEAVREDLPLGDRTRIGGDRIVPARPSHGLAQERLEGILGRPLADPDAGAGVGVMPNSAAIRHHDLDLLVGDRDVGALHRVAVGRLDHRAIALDRGDRLDPERMRLAIGREHAAIEPGEQAESASSLARRCHSFLAASPRQAGQAAPCQPVSARHRSGGACRDCRAAGRRCLAAACVLALGSHFPSTNQTIITLAPAIGGLEVNSKNSMIGAIFLWLIFARRSIHRAHDQAGDRR